MEYWTRIIYGNLLERMEDYSERTRNTELTRFIQPFYTIFALDFTDSRCFQFCLRANSRTHLCKFINDAHRKLNIRHSFVFSLFKFNYVVVVVVALHTL